MEAFDFFWYCILYFPKATVRTRSFFAITAIPVTAPKRTAHATWGHLKQCSGRLRPRIRLGVFRSRYASKDLGQFVPS